nr:hypothetical protein [uncultured Desulfobacter sp.]
MNNINLEHLLNISQLAKILGKTPQAVRTDMYRGGSGTPPPVRMGRTVRWLPSTVMDWIHEREEKPTLQKNRRGAPTKAERIKKLRLDLRK